MPNPYRLDLAFAIQPIAFDAQPASEKVRFTGIAYSGGVIPSYGWLGDVAIDLASLQNPNAQNIPVLIDHSAEIENIAGKGNLSCVGNALHITGELTAATKAGKQIAALLGEGYPLQLSVGMQANLRETTEATRSQQLNGQNLNVKAVFEQCRILEVSFVPTGADPHTSASQFAARALDPVSQTVTLKGVSMTRTAEDQALIDGLQSQITAGAEQIAALQAAIEAAATTQRTAELSALFTELGRDLPSDTTAYMAMKPESFAAFCADLRAMKPAPRDRALFSSQAASMSTRQTTPDAADKTAALQASIKKLTAKHL